MAVFVCGVLSACISPCPDTSASSGPGLQSEGRECLCALPPPTAMCTVFSCGVVFSRHCHSHWLHCFSLTAIRVAYPVVWSSSALIILCDCAQLTPEQKQWNAPLLALRKAMGFVSSAQPPCFMWLFVCDVLCATGNYDHMATFCALKNVLLTKGGVREVKTTWHAVRETSGSTSQCLCHVISHLCLCSTTLLGVMRHLCYVIGRLCNALAHITVLNSYNWTLNSCNLTLNSSNLTLNSCNLTLNSCNKHLIHVI